MEDYQKKVETLLYEKFGVTINDVTDEEQIAREFEDGTSAEYFVEFLGEKYELEDINQIY